MTHTFFASQFVEIHDLPEFKRKEFVFPIYKLSGKKQCHKYSLFITDSFTCKNGTLRSLHKIPPIIVSAYYYVMIVARM